MRCDLLPNYFGRLLYTQARLHWLALFSVGYLLNYVHIFVRYDTRCYVNVHSNADISQLNLPHGKKLLKT